MPAARRQTLAPRRNIRNGTILAVAQAAKLVNIPVAQDVVHHIRKMAVALKPSVLQAPKDNDASARELAECVIQLVGALTRAFEYMDEVGFLETDGSVELLGHSVKLRELRDQLSQIYSELQEVHDYEYYTKLASQAHIRDRILELKEELWQVNIRISVCTHAIVMHYHHATARAQRDTSHEIQMLNRTCRSLALQVNAMQAMRQKDEQKLANLVHLNQWLIFF